MADLNFLVLCIVQNCISNRKYICTNLYAFQRIDLLFLFTELKLPDQIQDGVLHGEKVKSFLKNGPSRYDKLPRIKPAMAFAFLNFVEICSSSFKGASRITQRSFLSKSCSNSFLWNIVIRFLLFFLFECQMYVNLADLKCKTITLLKWCNITKLELVLWFLIFYKI